MFKYGGPINEGVMHGMRSNYAGGQRVGAFNVGSPVKGMFPKDVTGREHHVAPAIGAGIWYGAQGLARLAPTLYRAITGAKNISKASNVARNVSQIQGGAGVPMVIPQVSRSGKVLNKIKNWFKADPLYSSVAGGTTALGRGIKWTGKKGLEFGKYATTTPSGLLFFGAPVTIAGGKWLLSDGTELNEEQKNQVKQVPQEGVPGGGDPGMQGTGEWFAAEAQKKLAEKNKADRKAKIAKYMDTMGYDQAKRGAIGKALIDASAIVQAGTDEAGSLKHADWGRMINQAIQATSKRLEKPEQIREAVGLMMTKAGIEKDMTAEADAQAKKKLNLQIKELEEKIDPSAADLALAMDDKSNKQVTLENIVKKVEGIDNLKASFKDVKDTAYGDWKDKKENKNKTSLDFMETEIKPSGVMVPGFYVFPTKIVQVTDDLTIKWYQ